MKFAISVPIGAWHDKLPLTFRSLFIQAGEKQIAVLDASNDPRVKSLIERYRDQFAYIRHGPDLGQSDAIMEGWDNIEGDWLGWLNADDALLPGAFKRTRDHYERTPNLEVIYGHSLIVDEQERILGYHFNVEPPGPRILQAGIISQPSCFFSRSSYERIGGLNRDLHYVMDWDLWIKLYLGDAKFGFVDFPLSRVVWASNTKTASLGKLRRDELSSIIGQHVPQHSQSAVFRDFMIDTLSDRLWPNALKRRLKRKLRSVSQTVLGLRGDGYIGETARLVLPVYQTQTQLAASLVFSKPPKEFAISCRNREYQTHQDDRTVHIELLSPIDQPTVIEIEIQRQADTAPFFEYAMLNRPN